MSPVDREEVLHVADLARLRLSEEEVERLRREMARVLEHFAELSETTGVEGGGAEEPPGGSPGRRSDAPEGDRLDAPPAEWAPGWRDGFFVVPRLEGPGDRGEEGGAGGSGREEP